MSGHSKWATTKHKKAVIDAKRGKLFAKLIKNVEVAARHADRLWVVGPETGMRVGTPHELAHDGTLEAAFGGDVGFDPDSYTFVSRRSQPDRGGHQGDT